MCPIKFKNHQIPSVGLKSEPNRIQTHNPSQKAPVWAAAEAFQRNQAPAKPPGQARSRADCSGLVRLGAISLDVITTRASSPNCLGATGSKCKRETARSQATAECIDRVLEQIQYQLGFLQSPASTLNTVLVSVSGLVSSSVVPVASVSVPVAFSVSVPSVSAPNQGTDNPEHCLEMQETNPAKPQTSTNVMIENITTHETENN
ncbi:hypothetical protein DSO57_1026412 [Entomophthora muscae]|uniref:Uncharacterized protein n=1 Tax=Entomophthora muscae TaxID=34485 RepID=A0ACC2UN38_9FUNG|nr:hypothetical protein DSO57_1026412 [Entomophthora muscae]